MAMSVQVISKDRVPPQQKKKKKKKNSSVYLPVQLCGQM